MKRSCYGFMLQLLMLTLVQAFDGKAQDQPLSVREVYVSLKLKDASLLEVFQDIEAKTNFVFNYDDRVIRGNQSRISLHGKRTVAEALLHISEVANVKFKQVNNNINVENIKPNSRQTENLEILLQTRNVSGKVVSMDDNEPLPGVNVVEKGTSNGTVTDIDGNYSLSVSEEGILVFSSVGFTTEEIPVGNRSVIDVSMVTDIQQLQELVVIGYGEQKKVNLTGSVDVIQPEEIGKRQVMQTSAALQGIAAGVTVQQNLGAPGSDNAQIRIRGISSFHSKSNLDPLVLIDGVPGSINDINPNDIESISILKDAASAAIYGSRAANGVILITTKRGSTDKVQFTYSTSVTTAIPTRLPQTLSSLDYIDFQNKSQVAAGNPPQFTDAQVVEWRNNVGSEDYPDTDWFEVAMKDKAVEQNHFLRFSGGTEKLRSSGSFGYQGQGGLLENTSFDRYSIRVNNDYQVNNYVRFNLDIFSRLEKTDRPVAALNSNGVDEIFRMINEIPPIFNARFSDGSWGPGWEGSNPVAAQSEENGFQTINDSRVQLNLGAVITPVKNLELGIRYAPKFLSRNSERYVNSYDWYRQIGGDAQPSNQQNQLYLNNARQFENYALATVNYKLNLGIKHTFNVLGGVEYIDHISRDLGASRRVFLLSEYPYLDNGSEEFRDNSGNASEWALASYFGRFNYNFNDKYLVEANLRYDGSSRFARGSRWGFFPSASMGWRINEEAFLSDVSWLTNLKVRASWGKVGNQNISDTFYPFASTIDLGGNYMFGNPLTIYQGGRLTSAANPDVTWENSEMLNFGIDFGIFNESLSGSIEYYVKNTNDILLTLPIPVVAGLNAPLVNAGKVENSGIDANVTYRYTHNDLRIRTTGIVSYLNNEVVDLAGTGPFINGRNLIQEGYPINSFYGYKKIGYFTSDEDVQNSPKQFGLNNLRPGDLKFEDTNKDGVVNEDDRQVIGNSFPDWSYGLNLEVMFRNFDFSLFFQGVSGRDGYLENPSPRYGGNVYTWETDKWAPENPDARWEGFGSNNAINNKISTNYIADGSYLRLKTLQLGYTFPAQLISGIGMQNLRVYAAGQNLWTVTSYFEGFDPEANSGAYQYYPNLTRFSLGLDLNF